MQRFDAFTAAVSFLPFKKFTIWGINPISGKIYGYPAKGSKTKAYRTAYSWYLFQYKQNMFGLHPLDLITVFPKP
jgi:hypothetical protein